MNINDPIEDLFRERSNETVGEKPRDLVWKRIETGLKDDKKKQKPIREFVTSVWFSAAVFALIAIPYFVLFIENLNTVNNKENAVEFVKTNAIEVDKTVQLDSVQSDLPKIEEIEQAPQVASNNVVVKTKSAENLSIQSENEINRMSSSEELSVTASGIMNRSKTLDSIVEQDQYVVLDNANIGKTDSISTKLKNSALGVKIEKDNNDTSNNMKMAVVASNRSLPPTSHAPMAASAPVFEVEVKKSDIKEATINYKPLKFTIKTDILRTNFKLLKKTTSKISFQNNSIIINFEKVNGNIFLTTNEPKMDATLLGLLEKNKKEIFNYYQNSK